MAQSHRPRTPLPGADVAPSPHRALPITIKPISKKIKRGAARFLSFVSPHSTLLKTPLPGSTKRIGECVSYIYSTPRGDNHEGDGYYGKVFVSSVDCSF